MRKRWLIAGLLMLCLSLAVFVACDEVKTFKVTFMNGDTVFHTETVDENDAVAGPETAPTKDADDTYTYTFRGWSLTEDGEPVAGLEQNVTSDLTYYAVYDRTEIPPLYYTVEFVDGVTDEVIDTQSVAAGEDAEPPVPPVHEGYTFKEWDGDYTAISRFTTITAVYTKNVNTLTFNVLDREPVEIDLEFGATLSEIEAPENIPDGLVFEGWYADELFSETLAEAYADRMPDRAISAYAKFSVDLSGAKLILPETNVYGGDPVSLDLPEIDGVTYAYAWSDGSKGANYSWPKAGSQTVTVTVTATYAYDGGAVVTQKQLDSKAVTVEKASLSVTVKLEKDSVTYGEEAPAVQGYVFAGFVGADEEKYGDVFETSVMQGGAVAGEKLAAGEYTVTAKVSDTEAGNALLSDYETTFTGADFTVEKKALTIGVSGDDIVYGTESPAITYSGFIDGENESLLTGTPVISYKKNGEAFSGNLTVGDYTAAVSGYDEPANYEIIYASDCAFTVTKATLTVSVTLDGTEYTYPDVPEVSFRFDGFVYDDTDSVVNGERSAVYQKTDGGEAVGDILSVGSYTVQAGLGTLTADNYQFVASPETHAFEVVAREITLSYTNNNLTSGNAWSIAANEFSVSGMPEGYVLGGTFTQESTAQGEYTLNGTELQNGFAWKDGCTVTLGGEGTDLSSNFIINYSVSIKFTDSSFEIEGASDFSTPYTGEEISLGKISVKNEPDGLKIEYAVGDGAFSEDMPQALHAGEYVVHFRISAPNYTTHDGQYTAEITQADNSIEKIGEFGSYTYNGTLQTVSFDGVLQAKFGTLTVEEGANTFTDVPEGGKLTFTVSVAGTDDYKGASYEVEITVSKANYGAEDIPEDKIEGDDIIVRRAGKTLAEVLLNEGFAWKNAETPLEKGGEFNAVYCADANNYNPFELKITVETRLQTITVTLNGAEIDLGTADPDYIAALDFAYVAEEDGVVLSNEDLKALCSAETAADITVGSTYTVTFTSNAGNDYYVVVFGEGKTSSMATWLKVKSVDVGGTLYTIEDALVAAANGDKVVIVTKDTAFASAEVKEQFNLYDGEGYYTVASGVTLLVPYSASATSADTNHVDGAKDTASKRYADENEETYLYSELTVPQGVTLTVQGTLSIGGVIGYPEQPNFQGHTSGAYGQISLEGTLNVNGTLDSYGYVKGNGNVRAYAGATVYAPFVVRDFRGGTWTSNVYKQIAPFWQYEMPNIQANFRVDYGALYYGRANLYALSQYNKVDAVIVGTAGVFELNEGGYLNKSFVAHDYSAYGATAAAGDTTLQLFGGAKDNALSMKIIIFIFPVTVTTKDVVLGIPYNMNIVFEDGTYDIGLKYKLLTGSSVTIGENATVNQNGQLIVYTEFEDKETTGSRQYPSIAEEGKLTVNGTLNINGIFGGLVYGGDGAKVVTSSSATLTMSSQEGYDSTKQTITKEAQLYWSDGVINMITGKTYTYTEAGWTE